jgi:hypothetical protein
MRLFSRLVVALGVLVFCTSPALANHLDSASASVVCNSYTLTVNASELFDPATFTIPYTITLTPSSGPAITITDTIAVTPDANGNFTATVTKPLGPLTSNFSLSGTASLVETADGIVSIDNTMDIAFSPSSSLTCQSSPPPPPPCTETATNSSNFNGTSVPGGSYIWFNANFKANHVPSTGVTIDFTNGNISFTAGGTPYSLPVPNAKITFSPSASCTSTTFDSITNTWMTTVPLSGDDEIFLTGLAWPVPTGGLPGGANPVNFSGTYSAESSAPGLSIEMKWGAAAYSNFTTDYNALQIKAGHQTACGMSNGDHAGTPEGVDNTNTPWKKYVVGGARGGGGSNFTGSWSGTLNITVCP